MSNPAEDAVGDRAKVSLFDSDQEASQMQDLPTGRAAHGRIPRTRDAATMILYRLDDDQPRILMGCRSSGHDFMPNKYVFPGGRVDATDGDARSLTELSPDQQELLSWRARRRARAYPLTAVREMFEETGLLVGRPCVGACDPSPPGWSEYFAQGVAPCLAGFTLLGRAVTPPMRSKRFDARFLMADAADALVDERPPVDGAELNDLRWFTLAEAAELDLPNVTRFVVSEVEARLVRREDIRPFLLRWTAEGHVRERL